MHLVRRLRRHIAHKNLRPGDFLGTEAELVQKYGVSRVTVRQALRMLERDGYISREKARGTFIKKALPRQLEPNTLKGTIVLACSNEQADQADEDHAFATMVRAVERRLTEREFTSQILGFGSDKVADRRRLREMDRRDDVMGICTIGPCLEPYADVLPDIPLVTSCTFRASTPAWVGNDTHMACGASINHLLANGHRDVAMMCGAQVDGGGYAIFAEAFVEQFEAAGIPFPRCLMYHAYVGESLEQLARQMLTGPIRPTAVFAENWKVCQAILTVASDLKIQVPSELSLVAFGRNVLQITYPLAITAFVPDQEQIGERTVDLLAAILDGEAPANKQIEVAGKLVERDSVRRVGSSLLREAPTP
jgi:DNA-binding LacI/PurR family transcriptional regulator